MSVQLIHGDCLEKMQTLAGSSLDLILCDLPYGTTQNKWDAVIPFDKLWEQYLRVAKPNAAIVLTAMQPFTSALVMSNPKIFKYEWTWNKVQSTGHLNAKKMPMKVHESVLVFYRSQPCYNPQMGTGKSIKRTGLRGASSNYGEFECEAPCSDETRYPTSQLTISMGKSPNSRPVHPTQKPVALMEYMIRTYTNEGDIVLDNCMGSGTTGVACVNTGRNFIGIEMDEKYFEIASGRINSAKEQQ